MNEDIPIKFVNATGNTNFQVIVFTKNFSKNTPSTCYCAWKILTVQSSAQFTYPTSASIAASYVHGGQKITAGPFPAAMGSTWEVTQPNYTAELRQGKQIKYR